MVMVKAIYGASKLFSGLPYNAAIAGDLSPEESASVTGAINEIVGTVEHDKGKLIADLPEAERAKVVVDLYGYLRHRVAPANVRDGRELLAELNAAG